MDLRRSAAPFLLLFFPPLVGHRDQCLGGFEPGGFAMRGWAVLGFFS